MPARLPQPGSDDGQWGDILNEFLQVAHQSDGSLKPVVAEPLDNSVTDAKIASDAAISADKLADGTSNKVMTAAERDMLAGATNVNVANTLMKRSGAGWTIVNGISLTNTPTSPEHGTRKDYVDTNGSASPADAPNISGSNNLGSPAFAPPKVRVMTMTGDVTIVGTPSSIGASRAGVTVLVFKQAVSGGPYAITWPDAATLPWAGGAAAPVMPTAANAELEVHLFWTGQSWRAKVGGTYFP